MTEDDRLAPFSGISSEALQSKTGRSWSDWFDILDGIGATKMSHSQIANYLSNKYRINGWWSQTITVSFERARGLRKKHEMHDGFAISRSKTISAPVENVYAAWQNADTRRSWLGTDRMEIRKATADKSLRITWPKPKSSLDVYFYTKGDHKSQVVVQQSKIERETDAKKMKIYWGERLAALKEMLEAH